jgi:ABC-2 type transport system permease protein
LTDVAVPAVPSFPRSTLAVARMRLGRAIRGAAAWGLGLGALSGLMIAIYPSFSSDLASIVETLPATMREAFGIEGYDTARSFLDGEMCSLLVPFAVALYAIRQVAHDLAQHEERSWLDVELTTPVGRSAMIIGCYVAALAATALVAALSGAGALIAALLADVDLPVAAVASGTLAVWLLGAGFGAVALAIGSVSHRSSIVLGGASAALVAMYVVELAGTLVDGLDGIREISPFEHYGSPVAHAIPASSAGLMALTALALVLLAAFLFERHDISG